MQKYNVQVDNQIQKIKLRFVAIDEELNMTIKPKIVILFYFILFYFIYSNSNIIMIKCSLHRKLC